MTRAVLDEAVPADAAVLLSATQVAVEGFPDEWRGMPDGSILDRAIMAGFDWLITCDKKMPFQQNLARRTISVLILPSPRLPVIEFLSGQLHTTLMNPVPGHFVHINDVGRPARKPISHLQGPKNS